MRKIKFIEPVESLRGNLSGSQKLKYPTNDNSAYDAPSGKKSYATNYRASYIGAQRAKDGKTYFAVKQRNAVNISSEQRLAMALLGASVSLNASMQQDPHVLQAMQSAYRVSNSTKTFSNWAQEEIRRGLSQHTDFRFAGSSVVYVYNPFASGHSGSELHYTIDNKGMLVKFWSVLKINGTYFTVEGQKGIATVNQPIGGIPNDAETNVLNLSISDGKMKMGDGWLTLEGDYVSSGENITPNKAFGITYEEPE